VQQRATEFDVNHYPKLNLRSDRRTTADSVARLFALLLPLCCACQKHEPQRNVAATSALKPTTSALKPTTSALKLPVAPIQKLSETEFVLSRDYVNKIYECNLSLEHPYRLKPVTEDGGLAGLRISQIKTTSAAYELGFKDNDLIVAIDGQRFLTPESLMKSYGNLRNANGVAVTLHRAGASLTIMYRIEPPLP
jgi:hypothetical protein